MSIREIQFISQSTGIISSDVLLREVTRFIRQHPERFYKIVVGTDSQPANETTLVTAITVWRVGNGAIHFWTKSPPKRFKTMRERIWQEALASITLAQELRSLLMDALGDEFFWDGNEIHVDIGRNGPTRELVDGVVGMIKGYNFQPVIKPYAFGASIVADRHT